MVDADYFLTVANQTLWVLALAAAPILIPALVSGLILGMIQAATSIQEQTLSFVPKLIVVGLLGYFRRDDPGAAQRFHRLDLRTHSRPGSIGR